MQFFVRNVHSAVIHSCLPSPKTQNQLTKKKKKKQTWYEHVRMQHCKQYNLSSWYVWDQFTGKDEVDEK